MTARILKWIVAGSLLLAVLLAAAVWWLLRGSLPQLSGQIPVPVDGLGAAVTITRDAAGVPSVSGRSFADVAFGLGYAHAQDRYFQMDLSRRLAAGELSALLGASTLEQDRAARRFRLRSVAREVIADATPAQREWIEAYTRGVNRGLDSLRVRPWEYLLLRQEPTAWLAEDSILVIHAMWWQLQHQNLASEIDRRSISARVEERLLAAGGDWQSGADAVRGVLQFLFPRGNEWDAPNFATLADAQAANGGRPFTAPEVPPPEWLDLRGARQATAQRLDSGRVAAVPSAMVDSEAKPGSNAWAVAGQHTASGVALVAGDMHLGLRVPTVWYRARLQITADDGSTLDLNGVTLPGLPAVAAGSNGHVAWSFTNSYGDWSDVRDVACSSERRGYLLPSGERAFEIHEEMIEIAGEPAERLEILDAPLGTVIKIDANAQQGERCWLARWLIVERGATNLASLELQQVRDIDAALALAPSVGIPQQNFTVGDRSGRIGWSIIGRIPEGDLGPETPRPIVWREAAVVPRIVDPESGRLWSANSRHVEGEFEFLLGNDEAAGGMSYDMGVRQGQIRDGLLALKQPATPADMLAIQLDDRAVLLDRWQQLLLGVLDEDALRNQPKRAELRRLAADWQGRAAVDSVSYRLVRVFRDTTRRAVWASITSGLQVEQKSQPVSLFEGSLWRLVTEQPLHMLPAEHADWREFLLAQADSVIRELEQRCSSLAECRWGLYNTTRIRHPLSGALGPLAQYLDMPAVELHGDMNVPRVAGPTFGASERFAVSPGREAEGYLQLPGGQSGHPLSPFYRTGFSAWVSGEAQPLLPGPTLYSLTLVPTP